MRERARRAHQALIHCPPLRAEPSLDETLAAAATLFDAGLHFEVHELLEPYWARGEGAERQALQGLIQIAVGYQHLANGNLGGARASQPYSHGGSATERQRPSAGGGGGPPSP